MLTTTAGARRLAASNVRGLRAGDRTSLSSPGKPPLHILATPCRHGPPLSRPVAGPVIGFAVTVADNSRASVWMTGDTVLTRPVRRLARRLEVDVLLVHLGAVRFPITGALRYSMNSAEAVELMRLLRPRVAVPVHYEGWSHFSEPRDRLSRTFATAAPEIRDAVTILDPGVPREF